MSGTGLQRQVAASHVLQGSVPAVLVKHLAHHSGVALTGNAEHSQRTGCLCLHALHALLDHAVKGDLLAQLELVHISGRALVHHLEQTGQLIGAGLQHLERLVSLDSVGHHAAIIAHQARDERLADAVLFGLVLNLKECDGLGLDAQSVSHTADNGSCVLGLVARQVEWLNGNASFGLIG